MLGGLFKKREVLRCPGQPYHQSIAFRDKEEVALPVKTQGPACDFRLDREGEY